jgi:uncharacterized protein (TIGR03067 family)
MFEVCNMKRIWQRIVEFVFPGTYEEYLESRQIHKVEIRNYRKNPQYLGGLALFFIPLVALLVFAPFVLLGCKDKESTRPINHVLIGKWKPISINGKSLPDLPFEVIWTIGESEIVVTMNNSEEISRNNYSIDFSKEPKQISMEIRDISKVNRLGIFKIDQDELLLSFGEDGAPHPKDWKSGDIMVLERLDPNK